MNNWYYEEMRAREASEAFGRMLREQELIRRVEVEGGTEPSALRRRVAGLVVQLGAWLDPESVLLQSRVLAADSGKAPLR